MSEVLVDTAFSAQERLEVGSVYLVGAGPGDTGLLTARAAELIETCDVLIYDALSNPAFLSRTKSDCLKIYVGKRLGKHSASQSEINALLVEHASAGRMVVRLKGGDPFVFGRGGEEAQALSTHGIPYQLVPGVTSAVAALESAGIPVTHREVARSFTVITGHTAANAVEPKNSFCQYAKLDGTLVFLMGVSHLAEIASDLIAGGKSPDTPVSIVEQGTTIRERRTDGTLSTIVGIAGKRNVSNPAVICVGAVAAFHFTSEALPLQGVRIAVTGTPALTEKLRKPLTDLGSRVYTSPYMQVMQNPEAASLVPPLSRLGWLIFTSTSGVHSFFSLIKSRGDDLRALAKVQFCVIGKGTAETLRSYGFIADFVPSRYTVTDMAQGFADLWKADVSRPHAADPQASGSNGIVCALRAKEGSSDLAEIFLREQIPFCDIPLYTLASDSAQLDALLAQVDALDYITFASSSGASAFFERYAKRADAAEAHAESEVQLRADAQPGTNAHAETDAPAAGSIPSSCTFVCIGEKTAETVTLWREKLKIPNRILTARSYTAEGIIQAISGDKK
ncbi:MAG: uroporphyrinogen-III C-methyltransferase [Treponema sp.]|nr:uroporphyrinogen-III C-methyltransferase [Treponema sp.]